MGTSCRAAVLWDVGQGWSVEDVVLRDPGDNQVEIKVMASGLCHTDDHHVTGDFPATLPLVGGHEGVGIVTRVGRHVTRVKEGDHVVSVPMANCGVCRFCNDGRSYLCDMNMYAMQPTGPDGIHAFTARGSHVAAFMHLGTFSEYMVAPEIQIVKIDDDIPFDAACLLGCGVPTGWGSAVNIAKPRTGDTVVVVGTGGVGMAAVQGARASGAANVVAVDPVDFKREQALKLGATHCAASIEDAKRLVSELTLNVMADSIVITVGVLRGTLFAELHDLLAKGGIICTTSVARHDDATIHLPIAYFMLSGKRIAGSVLGNTNPLWDIPRLCDMYRRGELKLDEMITRRYSLEDINQGYEDMHAGKNIRGIIVYA